MSCVQPTDAVCCDAYLSPADAKYPTYKLRGREGSMSECQSMVCLLQGRNTGTDEHGRGELLTSQWAGIRGQWRDGEEGAGRDRRSGPQDPLVQLGAQLALSPLDSEFISESVP